MRRTVHGWLEFAIVLTCSSFSITPVHSQQIHVGSPLNVVSDGFYEQTGFSFAGRWGNPNGRGSRSYGFFNSGGGFGNGLNSANPPFGGFVPGSGVNAGFGRLGSNGGGFGLNFSMAKGSSRSAVSSTPSMTVQNGFGGAIFNGQISPFVTSVVPIVGQMPLDNGVTRAIASGQLNLENPGTPDISDISDFPSFEPSTTHSFPGSRESSAGRPARSVVEIQNAKAKQQLEIRQKVDELLVEASNLESQGEPGLARLKIMEALRIEFDQDVRSDLKARLRKLKVK